MAPRGSGPRPRWPGLMLVAATMFGIAIGPLLVGLYRGLSDIGASADTSQAPYHARELIHALDYHREGFSSFAFRPSASQGPIIDCPNISNTSAFPQTPEEASTTSIQLMTLLKMLEERERRVSDVRITATQPHISRLMVPVYTRCIADSLLAKLCARRVQAAIASGLAEAERENATTLEAQRGESQALLCTYLAGVTKVIAEPTRGFQ